MRASSSKRTPRKSPQGKTRPEASLDTFNADIKLALESIETPDSSIEEQLTVTPQASTRTQALEDPDADPMAAIADLLQEYGIPA